MNSKYLFLRNVLSVLLGALLLDLPHLHNGFPFLLGDSQGYIIRAMTLVESSHWSNTYTLFVRWCITTFQTIQVVPYFQNLLISYLLYLFVSKLFEKHQILLFFGLIGGLLFTTLPWTSVMIMSDIFTPAALLIIYLVVNYRLPLLHLVPLGLIFFFASSCHQSNLAILPLFLIGVSISNLLVIRNKTTLNVLLIGLSLMALMLVSFVLEKHLIEGTTPIKTENKSQKLGRQQQLTKKKQLAKTQKVKKWKRKQNALDSQPQKTAGATGFYFIIVRLWEVGELDHLLESYCDSHRGNYLCDPNNPYEIKVHLPMLTDRNDRNANYAMYAADNRSFVYSILLKPRFYYACIKALFKRSPILLQQTQIRDFVPIKHGGIKNNLYTEPINDSRAYGLSKQFNGYYSSTLVKAYLQIDRFWWWILVPLTLIGVLIRSVYSRSILWISKERWNLLVMGCIAHAVNIIICGTFSNHLNSRYSMRTLWLVNLIIILLIIFLCEKKKQNFTKTNQANIDNQVSQSDVG